MAAKKTTTTKATTKKTTTKSTPKKTTTKKTQSKSKKTEKVDPKMERKQAKSIELSLAQFRVLKALSNGEAMTYRDIEKVTGYYSILTKVMRTKHDGSLCSRKLATEEMHDVNGRDVLAFRITAAGKKAVRQAEKVEA
ncbi:MarR family winged helix-turn-helix transcriptional regulator [Thalassoroseus pseudoceratinae]|uniref:MarR family winged helix-turn-helix transcriptional regulator n=1 Tax=Thalassoroseus pseudoceratinae TaxID=2713176 RepID=UPI00141DA54D|nr:MarR family winged helix-turn-helix transcriptional regulator [Thalassoroseus pseudoceratinae]